MQTIDVKMFFLHFLKFIFDKNAFLRFFYFATFFISKKPCQLANALEILGER